MAFDIPMSLGHSLSFGPSLLAGGLGGSATRLLRPLLPPRCGTSRRPFRR